MSQPKGYERFLKNANPKLEMKEYEFYTFRGKREEHLAVVMEECKAEEPRLRKLGRSNVRLGFAFLSFGVAAMQIFLASMQKDSLFVVGYLSAAGLFIISGIVTIGTISRKTRMAPTSLEEMQDLVRAYYQFHWNLADQSENYGVYRHKVNMANESDFHETLDRIKGGLS